MTNESILKIIISCSPRQVTSHNETVTDLCLFLSLPLTSLFLSHAFLSQTKEVIKQRIRGLQDKEVENV